MPKILFISTFIIFIVTLGAQVYLTNALALKSKELKELSGKKIDLQKDIAKLKYENSALSSLAYIEEQARTNGFVDMKEPINTTKPASVAVVLSQ